MNFQKPRTKVFRITPILLPLMVIVFVGALISRGFAPLCLAGHGARE